MFRVFKLDWPTIGDDHRAISPAPQLRDLENTNYRRWNSIARRSEVCSMLRLGIMMASSEQTAVHFGVLSKRFQQNGFGRKMVLHAPGYVPIDLSMLTDKLHHRTYWKRLSLKEDKIHGVDDSSSRRNPHQRGNSKPSVSITPT